MDTEIERLIAQSTKGVPTLKAFAAALDIPPARLYHVSKMPRQGVVYDSQNYNWAALERFFVRRLTADGPATLSELLEKAWELTEEFSMTNKRRAGKAPSNAKLPRFEGSRGKQVPIRKYPLFEIDPPLMTPGLRAHPVLEHVILLTKDSNVYVIVYQTKEYTVLRPVTPEGSFQGDYLKLISNQSLNSKGYGPAITNTESVMRKYNEN